MSKSVLPAIIRFGAGQVRDYHPADFEATLRSSFAGNPDSVVVLLGNPNGQRYSAACAAWAIGEGLLYVWEHFAVDGREACALRLTDAGRARYCGEGLSTGVAT